MTDPASVMAGLAAVALLVMLIAWWRAEGRADRAEAARDAAREERDLQRARAELAAHKRWDAAFRQVSEEVHWATVPRETPDSNAGGHALLSAEADLGPEEIEALKARFKRAQEQPTVFLPVLGDERPTVLLPQYPAGTPEYNAYASELRTELAKFAAGAPPYEYDAWTEPRIGGGR